MKLLVSILVASASAQGARRRGKDDSTAAAVDDGFGDYSAGFGDYGNDGFGDYSSYSFGDYGDSSYGFDTADYGDYAAGDYSVGDDYAGVADYNFDDTAGFEDYVAVDVVEATEAPVAAPAATEEQVRDFVADEADRPGAAASGPSATMTCLTGEARASDDGTFTSQNVGMTVKTCIGSDAAIEDTMDYCMVELRWYNNKPVTVTARCATASDCDQALTNNFQHPMGLATHHDLCIPAETRGFFGGRFNRESVCTTCSHITQAGTNHGYSVETSGAVNMLDKDGATMKDSTGTQADMFKWNRAKWVQSGFDAAVHYAQQLAGK